MLVTSIVVIFQVPSYFLGWWVMDKWGRRWILFETMMIGINLCT